MSLEVGQWWAKRMRNGECVGRNDALRNCWVPAYKGVLLGCGFFWFLFWRERECESRGGGGREDLKQAPRSAWSSPVGLDLVTLRDHDLSRNRVRRVTNWVTQGSLDVVFKCFTKKNLAPLIKGPSVPAILREVETTARTLRQSSVKTKSHVHINNLSQTPSPVARRLPNRRLKWHMGWVRLKEIRKQKHTRTPGAEKVTGTSLSSCQ